MERQNLCDETGPARVRGGIRRNSCGNRLYLLFLNAHENQLRPGSEVDALSITFRETTVTTKHLAEGIAADYDSEGRLAGLEILDAQKRFGGTETMRRVELEGVGT